MTRLVTNRWNRICVAFVLTLACSCSRQSGPNRENSFRYDQQIGLANLHEKSGCLASANPAIDPGTKLTVVDQPAENLAFDTPVITDATVVERLSEDCDNRHMLTIELSASGPTYYRIALDKEWQGNGYVFAILNPSRPVTVNGKNIEGDLDGDGSKETFRICTSNEGAHYQVWTGEPLQGQPHWHWYVYAGYDTANSCTEKDYFGPK
jgi:hypothetical protein